MDQVTLLVQASLIFVEAVTGQQFQVTAAARPQEAPAWVIDTDTYKAAFKQGVVYAINYIAPPVVEAEKKSSLPTNIAGSLGFAGNQGLSVESLTQSGMTPVDAHNALTAMKEKNTPAQSKKRSNLNLATA